MRSIQPTNRLLKLLAIQGRNLQLQIARNFNRRGSISYYHRIILIYQIVLVYQTYSYGFCISTKCLFLQGKFHLIFDIPDGWGVQPGSGK